MIVRTKPSLWDLVFTMRGSVLPHIAYPLLSLMAVAALLVTAERVWHPLPVIDAAPFTVFGIALSLFLGFRNNAAYDRWWEARRLWGGLVADLRSLAREAEVFLQSEAMRRELLEGALVFLHVHRISLRQRAPDPELLARASALLNSAHPSDAALDRLATLVAHAHTTGVLDGFGARTLSARIASLALQQAGCERIAGTPLPYVYSLLIYRTTYLYCLLLPLALVGLAGWLTPLFVCIVAYVFLGLAEVSEELSQPFGENINALPLDALCRAVEISLAPHLGREPPSPLHPKDFHLG